MATIFDQPEEDVSGKSRLHFWKVAWLMAIDNPFWGVGIDHYQDRYGEYDFLDGAYGENRAVHSLFFLLLAEIGIIGFIIFSVIVFCCFRSYWQGIKYLKKNKSEGSLTKLVSFLPIGLSGFLMASIFVNTFHTELIWFYVTVAITIQKFLRDKNATFSN